MIKIEEYLEREEFEVSLRLKSILDKKSKDFSRINRLDILYQRFCSSFKEKIKNRVNRSISKHIRLLSHKLHELILAFKTSQQKVELHKEITLFYEVSLLRKVQLVCEQGGVETTFFTLLESNLDHIRNNIFSEIKIDSLSEKIIEVFCFQFLIGGLKEGIYPEKGGRLTPEMRVQLADFSCKALVELFIIFF
jgi:hypothetical protein